MARYNIFKNEKGKIIVTSTYAKKTVRGVASWDKEGEYDEELGIQLAKARCDVKIANKRVLRAKEKCDEAAAAYKKATKSCQDSKDYLLRATEELNEAMNVLQELYVKLGISSTEM